jgi:hypothetical protein
MEFKKYETLDDIGFIGNPRHKYSEEDEKFFSAFFRTLRNKRSEWLKEPTREEMKQFAQNFYKSYKREQKANRKVAKNTGASVATLRSKNSITTADLKESSLYLPASIVRNS